MRMKRGGSPDDNRYYTKAAPSGEKYLIAFVDMVDRGKDRATLPPQANLNILYNAASTISPDPSHALPNLKADSPPSVIRIGEIEFELNDLHSDFYRSDATAGPVIVHSLP